MEEYLDVISVLEAKRQKLSNRALNRYLKDMTKEQKSFVAWYSSKLSGNLKNNDASKLLDILDEIGLGPWKTGDVNYKTWKLTVSTWSKLIFETNELYEFMKKIPTDFEKYEEKVGTTKAGANKATSKKAKLHPDLYNKWRTKETMKMMEDDPEYLPLGTESRKRKYSIRAKLLK